jgi:hypothetical protein
MNDNFFVIVYDDKSKSLADYIAEVYHLKFDILYLDRTHPKEKKEAIYYQTIAGTSKCPFLGLFDNGNQIIDALWGETTKINQETISNFFKKYELRGTNYKVT